MRTVLIVLESETFGKQIRNDLRKDHNVLLCQDAYSALQQMDPYPDALVIQMHLPGLDGLSFLEQLSWRPPVILSVSDTYSAYEYQKLHDLGVGFFVRTPCTRTCITDRLRDMMRGREYDHQDPQTTAAKHLTILGIPSSEGGGKQLRVGIPLYAQDRTQKMTGQLYPAIAKICNSTKGGVERRIRRTIEDAWEHREASSWNEYFPNVRCCPSNRVFISTLAEKLWPD